MERPVPRTSSSARSKADSFPPPERRAVEGRGQPDAAGKTFATASDNVMWVRSGRMLIDSIGVEPPETPMKHHALDVRRDALPVLVAGRTFCPGSVFDAAVFATFHRFTPSAQVRL